MLIKTLLLKPAQLFALLSGLYFDPCSISTVVYFVFIVDSHKNNTGIHYAAFITQMCSLRGACAVTPTLSPERPDDPSPTQPLFIPLNTHTHAPPHTNPYTSSHQHLISPTKHIFRNIFNFYRQEGENIRSLDTF